MNELLDIYTDYLISQNGLATATGLSNLVPEISHDQVTRFLNKQDFSSKDLWKYVKPDVRKSEAMDDGVLILDDSIEEKPYTDENDLICWHHCHSKGHHVKGVNILSCLVRYGDNSYPIGYELIHKTIRYCDIETKKERRMSEVTKNDLFRSLISQAKCNDVKFSHILADNWFGSKENIGFIHNELKKKFIIGIKSNRTIALSKEDKIKGNFTQVKLADIKEDEALTVYLKGIDFPLKLVKKVFKNENGTEGNLYLISNDFDSNAHEIYSIYQKRWDIEVYHKSIKQNSSLAKSPTKVLKSQSNHIFASIIGYCKLQALKLKNHLNHFAIKHKLILKANQAAIEELKRLKLTSA